MPCIHGDVCRAYTREKCCILRTTCPKCEYYEPLHKMPAELEQSTCTVMYYPLWWEER